MIYQIVDVHAKRKYDLVTITISGCDCHSWKNHQENVLKIS